MNLDNIGFVPFLVSQTLFELIFLWAALKYSTYKFWRQLMMKINGQIFIMD